MTTIMPQSELLRRAVAHISERLAQTPKADLCALLDEAGMRFNLNPLDAASLERLFRQGAPKA